MAFWNRFREAGGQAAPASPIGVSAGLIRQFADAGVEDAERMARRAAAAGLAPDHIKNSDGARYIVFRALDADQAKRFLIDDVVVDATGIFFVVETPDGNWGKDIDGLFLENLLPWQRNVAAAEYVATIVMIPGGINPSGVFWSAGMGIADNYVAQLVCGRCRARWWDGIRYGDFTAVRCPSCRGLNQADSRTWVMPRYVSLSEDDIPAVAPIEVSPLTAEEIAEPRQVGQRLVGLIEGRLGTGATQAQMDLSLDQDYLDTSLASGQPLTGWMGACAEIRAIGHQLHGVGGTVLMQRVLDTVTHEHLPIERVVDYYWRRIGGWRN